MIFPVAVATLLSIPLLARADVVPTEPAPGDVFNAGAQCTINWNLDTTGQWKSLGIELMTGDNLGMVHLTTVATVDGTTTSSFSWTCPEVTINGPIYFYQFSSPNQNRTWTGRFTIASASGATVPAPNAKQPDGEDIPWGAGSLSDPSSATPPPPWLSSTSAGSTQAIGSAAGSAPVSTASASSAVSVSPSSAVTSAVSSAASPSSAAASSAAPAQASGFSRVPTLGSSSSTASTAGAQTTGSSNTASNGTSTSGSLGRADMIAVLTRGVTALAVIAGVFTLAI